jgi:hypothetical protein
MRSTYRTLNDYEMQRNAGVGLFTRSSKLLKLCVFGIKAKGFAENVNQLAVCDGFGIVDHLSIYPPQHPKALDGCRRCAVDHCVWA